MIHARICYPQAISLIIFDGFVFLPHDCTAQNKILIAGIRYENYKCEGAEIADAANWQRESERPVMKKTIAASGFWGGRCFCCKYKLLWLIFVGEEMPFPAELFCGPAAGYRIVSVSSNRTAK